MEDDENVVILEQGSVPAQKIAKAMASPTAGELFNVLSDGPLTATALSERTGFPLTTVKYHLDNLLDAELIEVVDTRWSEKGREMKIYGVIDKVVVLAPRKRPEIRQVVERYGVIAGAVAVGSAVILAATNIFKNAALQSGTTINPGIAVVRTLDAPVTEAATHTAITTTTIDVLGAVQTGVLLFFAAAVLVLFGMMIYEIWRIKKNRH